MTFQSRRNRRYGIVQYNPNQFDASSGQAFNELTVRARPTRRLSRMDSPRGVRISKDGPESLEKLAMREFLRYVQDTTPDTMHELTDILTHLPWPLGRKAWEEAQRLDLQSPLAVWQSFTSAYPGEDKIRYHRAAIPRPDPDELPLYIGRLNSPSYSWLTCLTITEHTPEIVFRDSDVLNISRLHNLVALDIGSPDQPGKRNRLVTDGVVRSWARFVDESQSFPKLQVLVVRNQPEVTTQSLKYLSNFPSLALFGVMSCFTVTKQTESVANSLGWTSTDEHGILAQIQKDTAQSRTWDEAIHQSFRRSSTLLPPSATIDAPLLNFRLGPTPTSIIFIQPFNPLVFFRCLACSTSHTKPIVPVISHPVPEKANFNTQHQNPFAKRRKLKKQVDLGGCLDEMQADAMTSAGSDEVETSTPARPHTVAVPEGWYNHNSLNALSPILNPLNANKEKQEGK